MRRLLPSDYLRVVHNTVRICRWRWSPAVNACLGLPASCVSWGGGEGYMPRRPPGEARHRAHARLGVLLREQHELASITVHTAHSGNLQLLSMAIDGRHHVGDIHSIPRAAHHTRCTVLLRGYVAVDISKRGTPAFFSVANTRTTAAARLDTGTPPHTHAKRGRTPAGDSLQEKKSLNKQPRGVVAEAALPGATQPRYNACSCCSRPLCRTRRDSRRRHHNNNPPPPPPQPTQP